MKHSATGLLRKDTRNPNKELKVRLDLTMQGKKYPELDVGDEVKTVRKGKFTIENLKAN